MAVGAPALPTPSSCPGTGRGVGEGDQDRGPAHVWKPLDIRTSDGENDRIVTINFDDTEQEPPFLTSLRSPAQASVPTALAEELRQELLRRRPATGTRLFGLGDLQRRTGYGPGVVREALQHLQSTGLIEVRQGAKGGVFARQAGHDIIARSFDSLILSNAIPRTALIETRQELEGLCARLAAGRRTEQDLAALDQSVHRTSGLLRSPVGFAEENINFHLLVCQSTKNELLMALARALRETFFAETTVLDYSPEALAASVGAHTQLVKAIREGNGERARAIMLKHIQAFDSYVSETHQLESKETI